MKRGRFNIIFGGQAGYEGTDKLMAYLADKFAITHFASCPSAIESKRTAYNKNGTMLTTSYLPAGVVGARNQSKVSLYVGAGVSIGLVAEDAVTLEQHGILGTDIFVNSKGLSISGGACLMSALDMVVANITEPIVRLLDSGTTFLCSSGIGVESPFAGWWDCPAGILAKFGLHPKYLGDVYVVIRPYPVGMYKGAATSWEEIRDRCGAPPEMDLSERVFPWGKGRELILDVFRLNLDRLRLLGKWISPDYICLQQAHYIDWEMAMKGAISELPDGLHPAVDKTIQEIEAATMTPVAYLGTGGLHHAMIDLGQDEGW